MATWVWIDENGNPAEYILDTVRQGDSPVGFILHFAKPLKGSLAVNYELPDGTNGTLGTFEVLKEPMYIPENPKRTYRYFRRNYPYHADTYQVTVESQYLAQDGLLKLIPQDVWDDDIGTGFSETYGVINVNVEEGVADIGNTVNYSNYLALLAQIGRIEQNIPIRFTLNDDETVVSVSFPTPAEETEDGEGD